jgi:hypothetical protein
VARIDLPPDAFCAEHKSFGGVDKPVISYLHALVVPVEKIEALGQFFGKQKTTAVISRLRETWD